MMNLDGSKMGRWAHEFNAQELKNQDGARRRTNYNPAFFFDDLGNYFLFDCQEMELNRVGNFLSDSDTLLLEQIDAGKPVNLRPSNDIKVWSMAFE